jgi:uncharacterized protein (TIGR02145 family)
MKKIFTLILGVILAYSCSSSSDENGNTTVAPVPPTNLTGAVASTTQINLSWTDNSTNETGFKIERKTGTGTYVVVGTTATDVTTFSDAGLNTNTTYIYRVYSYNIGGNSPTYSNEVTVLLSTLPYIIIGTQIWQSTNLDVTTYRDGTPIPQVTDPSIWQGLSTGAWCYYNNDPANGAIYGKLYNWFAVAGIYDNASLANPSLRKQLAPQGWHIPSDAEWTTLTTFLGGESVAGGKMKSTGTSLWLSPNTAATNESGFTGLPGGYRNEIAGFDIISNSGFWWSYSNTVGVANAESRSLSYNVGLIYGGSINSQVGMSVRCLKD